MKKTRSWPFLLILFLIATAIIYSRLITHSMVLGKYDFKYHECFAGAELPDRDDELTLLDNNKYRSSFFGNGEYHVAYGVFDTRLVLRYSGGTASCELVIKKRGNSIVIVVDDTCDFFYEKAD
ncbi:MULTISPECIES: hypothetical protein [Sphingobacterium]|jgi:hypothetical protein|uniref:Uncharacterized protein n=2 Tax=Sphingobacterium TaxID=28453 RepID=A0ACD5C862_9SPHI|nr:MULTISPECIES: hypothetical protein [Sphingobacterium]QQT62724.1 hypothetical protein I6I97_02585 [Sphingobacterium multivorum]QRQ59885.1 hypothetical protein I6J33_17160 [Sphingobacterium multivorum]SPZ83681.1 Uncharacterised protein [Sphingobacterium multivorum]